MEKRCDALAALLDERRGTRAPRDRLGERAALLVHPRLALRRPVGEIEGGVAQRRRQRVAQRHAVAQGDREVGDARPRETRAEDPDEEGHGHQRERREGRELDRVARLGVDRADEAAHHESDERDEREEVDGANRAPQRRRRSLVAPHEAQEDERRQRGRAERDRDVGRLRDCGAVRDEERALGAVRAPPDRRRVDEAHEEWPERDEREHRPDDPFVAWPQAPARVRQDQVRECDERDSAEDVAEREEQRMAGELQRTERPQEPDCEHLRAGPVVGGANRRDHARHREDQSRDRHHRDQRARLAQVGRHDEV